MALPSSPHIGDQKIAMRIAESALATKGLADMTAFRSWYERRREVDVATVNRIELGQLDRWRSERSTGNIGHDSGKFFTVEGLEVHLPGSAVPRWTQPIINQPEIGILGILVKEFDGVLHCLMQAKNEPGNCNGVQLSPTVQATRSNYSRVHQGNPVPYLKYFQHARDHHVAADVLQSEQGAWFYQKRNRNMVVEVEEDVELLDNFFWLTLGQVHALMAEDNLVNMDARTVLSCLPFSGVDLAAAFPFGSDHPDARLVRSCSEDEGSRHTTSEIMSWITEERARHEVRATRLPLNYLQQWKHLPSSISHESGLFFSVMAIDVQTGHREVSAWTQPMIEPHGVGVVAFLAKEIDGVLHVLVQAKVEPGYLDVIELGPTVQCTPENYPHLPAAARPLYLDEVLSAPSSRILFDAELSEEGGRFFNARNRYLVVEVDDDLADDHPAYRWMTLHQLVGLLRHSHYVNVQARSLVACLHSRSSAVTREF